MSALEVGTGAMEWCNKCLTTSALIVDLLHVHDDGVSVVGSIRRCFNCDPDYSLERKP